MKSKLHVDAVRPTFVTAGPDAFVVLARVGLGAAVDRLMVRPILPDGSMGPVAQLGGAHLANLRTPDGRPLDPGVLPAYTLAESARFH